MIDVDLQGTEERPPEELTLLQYQRLAKLTDRSAPDAGKLFTLPLLGLFGEVGGLLSELKKKQRDADSYIDYVPSIIEEFGDVLWYFSLLASRANIKLWELVPHSLIVKLGIKSDASLTFSSLQPEKNITGPNPTETYERTLFTLAGKVGALLENHTRGEVSTCKTWLTENMSAGFETLITTANGTNISLAIAAHNNLKKVFDRWPLEFNYPPFFDDSYDSDEQLPRLLEIDVLEKKIGDKTYVLQRYRDINIGDRLTDNKMEEDDYRFHDVFHLAYAAVLGWSPVTRALLHAKRKSNPKIDEAEDGARAIVIEEGISAWIFSNASRMKFFQGLDALSYGLLKTVKDFVKGFEVEKCPSWLWERAILDGYHAFRYLRIHRKGRIIVDMNKRILRIEGL